jgi:hypothetical protein
MNKQLSEVKENTNQQMNEIKQTMWKRKSIKI